MNRPNAALGSGQGLSEQNSQGRLLHAGLQGVSRREVLVLHSVPPCPTPTGSAAPYRAPRWTRAPHGGSSPHTQPACQRCQAQGGLGVARGWLWHEPGAGRAAPAAGHARGQEARGKGPEAAGRAAPGDHRRHQASPAPMLPAPRPSQSRTRHCPVPAIPGARGGSAKPPRRRWQAGVRPTPSPPGLSPKQGRHRHTGTPGAQGWGRALLGRPMTAPCHKDRESVPLEMGGQRGATHPAGPAQNPDHQVQKRGSLAGGTSGLSWPTPRHAAAPPEVVTVGDPAAPTPAGWPCGAVRTRADGCAHVPSLPAPAAAQRPRVCEGGMGSPTVTL